MGHQVNFYLTEADQKELSSLFDEVEGISAFLEPIRDTKLVQNSAETFSQWRVGQHRVCLFLWEQRDSLNFEKLGSQKLFFNDCVENNIVQFDRCIHNNKSIQIGRLYYVSKYPGDDGYLVEKSPEFVSFAKRLFSITKKFCGKPTDGEYFGPRAKLLVGKGYKFISQ
jgi:hypothetical protein